mmetsp:Transcript_25698/g.96773  ORF Transcript_25698/g.96773 Transcript_25698/m.96773 type:complete len:219 (-) Transcript_25698:483-1139(-)
MLALAEARGLALAQHWRVEQVCLPVLDGRLRGRLCAGRRSASARACARAAREGAVGSRADLVGRERAAPRAHLGRVRGPSRDADRGNVDRAKPADDPLRPLAHAPSSGDRLERGAHVHALELGGELTVTVHRHRARGRVHRDGDVPPPAGATAPLGSPGLCQGLISRKGLERRAGAAEGLCSPSAGRWEVASGSRHRAVSRLVHNLHHWHSARQAEEE